MCSACGLWPQAVAIACGRGNGLWPWPWLAAAATAYGREQAFLVWGFWLVALNSWPMKQKFSPIRSTPYGSVDFARKVYAFVEDVAGLTL